jgi:hypothetical protein
MKVLPIDTINEINSEAFRTNYLIPQRPVVIKNLAAKHPAGTKWTLDYIDKVCGDVLVDIYDNSNDNSASAYTSPDLRMKFSEYFKTIRSNTPSLYRIFLFNMFKFRPELREDFPCPDFFKGMLGKMGFMFFGARDIKVRVHQDMDMSNVMLTQFYGRKKVVLIAPQYSRLLYKLPFNTHSLVDLDKPDYDKFPGLRYVETYECILEPGDALFMPSGYWHYITYIDAGFSVSYRKLAFSLSAKISGVLHVCVYMPVDKLMVRLLGPRWLEMKKRMAEKRANREIRKLKGDDEKGRLTVQVN